MLYLASNTIPDISFAVQQSARFTHNTKASHETPVKRICSYLQTIKDNGLVFNPSKKLVVDCYADVDFAGLWGHEDPQDPICARSRTGFVVSFSNCNLLWMSKLQTEITLSTLHSEYVLLYHSTIVKGCHKSSSTSSTHRLLRIFMSSQSRKICISITIHHQFLGWIKH